MPSSQSSFETRYGRFSSGTGLIQDITTYNPAKEIIKPKYDAAMLLLS